MLKKTVTYVDYNGNEITQDFYFNLTQAETVELETSYKGGLSSMLQKIIEEKEEGKIISMFKEIILASYGEKSEDGKRFLKTEEVKNNLLYSPAYSIIFMELATNADAASAFIKGILPEPLK